MFSKIFILIALFISTTLANVEYDGWLNIRLQHALNGNDEYTDRGNITIQSVRSGNSFLDQPPLKSADMTALKELAKSDGFYKLKSIVQGSDGVENVFLSSIKSETLLSSNLNDIIRVWVLNNGAIAAVGVSPHVMEIPIEQKSSSKFSTNVFIHYIEQAPVPDTASYIQKLEREREAREKGEFKDNRSFLAKYWMYIIPVAIFLLLSGAANPEQAAGR